MSTVYGFIELLAGISWEPEIRGALTVALSSAVLMGSVWLLLVTNSGARLGSLIALAGFFGWMAIMGYIWWIYGIGLVGDRPAWEAQEWNVGDIEQAVTGPAAELPPPDQLPTAYELIQSECPGLEAVTNDWSNARENLRIITESGQDTGEADAILAQSDDAVAATGLADYCTREVGELVINNALALETSLTDANNAFDDNDPGRLTDIELTAEITAAIEEREYRNTLRTLSELAAVPGGRELIDASGASFGSWTLLSSAQAGEANASADAFLNEEGVFDNSGQFLVLDTFQQGGKDKRDGDGIWPRVRNRAWNIVRFWHPTNYAIVQVQQVIDKPVIPGAPPAFAEPDPDQPVISVIMTRNLGNLRLPPALIALGSTIVFLALCGLLHSRDRELARRLEEYDGANA